MKTALCVMCFLTASFANLTFAQETDQSAQEIIDAYYSERYSVINPAIERNSEDSDYYQLVSVEKNILEVLKRHENKSLQVMTVLHSKLSSINKVRNNIFSENTKKDKMAKYIVSKYKKRMERLKADVIVLREAL